MKTLALLLTLLAAGAAAASDTSDSIVQNSQATSGRLTRAEVKAELARARAAGEIQEGDGGAWFHSPAGASALTRSEVRADVARARAAGELQYGEDLPSILPRQAGIPRKRDAVRAEAKQAARNHRQDAA